MEPPKRSVEKNVTILIVQAQRRSDGRTSPCTAWSVYLRLPSKRPKPLPLFRFCCCIRYARLFFFMFFILNSSDASRRSYFLELSFLLNLKGLFYCSESPPMAATVLARSSFSKVTMKKSRLIFQGKQKRIRTRIQLQCLLHQDVRLVVAGDRLVLVLCDCAVQNERIGQALDNVVVHVLLLLGERECLLVAGDGGLDSCLRRSF